MPETTLYGTPGTPQSKEPVDKNKLQKSLISLRSTYEKVKPNPRRRRAAFHPWRQSLLMLIIPFLKCLIYSEESHHAYLSWIKAPELTTSPPCFLWDSLILYHVSFTHTHADNRVKQSTLQRRIQPAANRLLMDTNYSHHHLVFSVSSCTVNELLIFHAILFSVVCPTSVTNLWIPSTIQNISPNCSAKTANMWSKDDSWCMSHFLPWTHQSLWLHIHYSFPT